MSYTFAPDEHYVPCDRLRGLHRITAYAISLLEHPEARVVGIDNFDPMYSRLQKQENMSGVPGDRFEFHELDIRDQGSLAQTFSQYKPDMVFHMAALAGVRPSIAEPTRYADVNITGTMNLLQAMQSGDCSKLVFASSSSVYGNACTPPFC